ncbi:MAG: ORF6N domain-containing protein [Bacteroidetes bacterium]|nr:ORF6N domain-containing protein [Bacteroidota bacterium]
MNLLPIKNLIYELRGYKVMLDFDLAAQYGIETAQLKRAVRRNIARFEGEDFMFELTKNELDSLRCQIGILNKGRGSNFKYMPFAFTELGVAMLSSVLNSEVAIGVNRKIMRAFVFVRHIALSAPIDKTSQIEHELRELKQYIEETFADYNDINEETRAQLEQINQILAAMQMQNHLPAKPRRKIGFFTEEQRRNNEDMIE